MPYTLSRALPFAAGLVVFACGSSSTADSADGGAEAAAAPSACRSQSPKVDPNVCTGQLSAVGCNTPADGVNTLCYWGVSFPCGLPGEDAGAGSDAGSEPSVARCDELCAVGAEYPKGVACSLSRSDAGPAVYVQCGQRACGA
jgi:hypothetical protein